MSAAPPKREAGLRLIIAYKLIKGIVSLTASAALAVTILLGGAPRIASWATSLAHHMTRAWSLHAAHALESATQGHRLWFAAGALAADGLLTTVEGWALSRGHRWGEWLVVVATGSLLPFEVLALLHGVHVWRIAAFVVNAAVVVYLARRVLRRHAVSGAAPPTPAPPSDPRAPSRPLAGPPSR